MKKITLLIHCKDRYNIIASVTNYIVNKHGNIVYLDQHVDREQDIFFMRIECEFDDMNFSPEDFKTDFKNIIAEQFNMKWRLYRDEKKSKNGTICVKI